jgi:hypothetical protein
VRGTSSATPELPLNLTLGLKWAEGQAFVGLRLVPSLRLAAIVDLPDGSFELPPNPKIVRQLKLIIGASTLLSIGAWVAFVVLTLNIPQIPWPIRLLPFLFIVPTEWFAWTAIRPPVLKADAMEISSVAPLSRQRMARSDLRLIFRGQLQRPGRYGGKFWDKSYIFVASDGKVGLSCSPVQFTEEGIAQFAQRLHVPVRGDFSTQVKDRLDPTETQP